MHLLLVAVALCCSCGARSATQQTAGKPVTTAAIDSPPTNVAQDIDSPPVLAINWDQVKLNSDEDALALWRKINPTSADLSRKLGDIPDRVDIVRPLAFAVLRGGNFACPTTSVAQSCNAAVVDFVETQPDAGFDDPCLRRELALWAIGSLDDDDALAVRKELVAIAALPRPERALIDAALDLLPVGSDGDALAFDILAAAKRPELALPSGLGESTLKRMLASLHLRAAVEMLSFDNARSELLAAMRDKQLAREARLDLIREAADLDDVIAPDVKATLLELGRSEDCLIAAGAREALGKWVKQPAQTPLFAARELCIVGRMAEQSEAGLQSLLDPKGVVSVNVAEADISNARAELIDAVNFSFEEIEKEALAGECNQVKKQVVCSTPNASVTLDFRAVGRKFVLSKVLTKELLGCED